MLHRDAHRVIQAAKAGWLAEQKDLSVAFDKRTDEIINRVLAERASRVPWQGMWLYLGTEDDLAEGVRQGLDEWRAALQSENRR